MRQLLLAAALLATAAPSTAAVRITEFMSEGQGLTGPGSGANRQREFIELTNLGGSAVSVTGWTYNDDNPNDPIAFGDAIGSIAAGESIILTQMSAENFRSYWGLADAVKVFSFGQRSNLGNGDTINIYSGATQDATTLVDTLSYVSAERGSGVSRNRPFGGDGATTNDRWVVSAVGDRFGSRLAPNPLFPAGAAYVDLANPGAYAAAAVPEPATWATMIAGFMLVGGTLRRRRVAFA